MDLESESSALESVDDNGLIQQSAINIDDDGRSFDNGSYTDESVKLISISTAREKSVQVGKQMNFDSPGGVSSPLPKGHGLRKWRRIKRDIVKDSSGNMENSKVLKRGLSGLVHSHGKQMQFQSPESQGSVGSVNMLSNTNDDDFDFDLLRTGYDSRFVAVGMDSVKDDDLISYEKTMIRGKVQVENSKKHRGEKIETEKESGKVMYYNGENGDEEESINKNNLHSDKLDPLTEAIDGFFTLKDALEKEVKQFQEIGKEQQMLQNHEGASEIVTLMNNIEQLEIKLEETRPTLNLGETETVVEDIFRQRTEAEIEYLIYSRFFDNLNNQMKMVEEQEALAEEEAHKTLDSLEKVETKAANLTNRAQDLQNECRELSGTMQKRVCKNNLYLLIQLVLLLIVVLLFMSRLLPESDIIVPT